MEIQSDKFDYGYDRQGNLQLTITVPKIFSKSAEKFVNSIKNKLYDVVVKEHRNKRSHRANAYAWQLITQIAECINSSKDEVYLEMLRRYGQSEIMSTDHELKKNALSEYYEEIGESPLNGKMFKHYKVYKGSSRFDTHEMSVLIDGIVSEAEELEIETLPPQELESMVREWRV